MFGLIFGLTLFTTISGQIYSSTLANPGTTFGSNNDTAFSAASQNPNITRSVPFQMGDANFTFRVNVAEFAPSVNSVLENARVAASFYELEWSDGSNLNDTMGAVESITATQSPRLCVALPLGLLSASVNNGYKADDNGDCSGALGEECVNDLMQSSYELDTECRVDLPESCVSKLDTGGMGATCESNILDIGCDTILTLGKAMLNLGFSQNSTNSSSPDYQMSPSEFAYWSSPIYSAGNDTYFEREAERLHVVIFYGTSTYPVCLRVRNDHVNRNSPATSEAARGGSSSLLPTLAMALGAVLWMT